MQKKSIFRRVGGAFLRYLTPWSSISRSAGSVAKSISNIADAARGARDAMRADHERIKAAREVQLSPEQRRMSPAQLFENFYEEHDWQEPILARNRLTYRKSKRIYLASAAAGVVAGIAMTLIFPHPLFLFFIVPTALLASLILASKGMTEAWRQAQIELRSMISLEQFLGRGDLFKRLVA